MQNEFCNPFKIMELPDEYTVAGSQNKIFNHYGISGIGITNEALNFIAQ
jgi:transketolase